MRTRVRPCRVVSYGRVGCRRATSQQCCSKASLPLAVLMYGAAWQASTPGCSSISQPCAMDPSIWKKLRNQTDMLPSTLTRFEFCRAFYNLWSSTMSESLSEEEQAMAFSLTTPWQGYQSAWWKLTGPVASFCPSCPSILSCQMYVKFPLSLHNSSDVP